MRNLAYGLLITIGILVGFDYALKAEEVTTGNLLNNSTFGTGNTTTTTGWSTDGDHGIHTHGEWGFPYQTGMDDSGGVLAFEGHTEDNVYQDVDLVDDGHLTQHQMNQGFTSTMAADVWFWNSIENTLTLKQTITGSDGSVSTQIREINDNDSSRSMNGGEFTNYTNVHIQGSNTQTDITIRSELYNETAGTTYDGYHRGPDVDNVTLNITYQDIPPINEDTQEVIDNIENNIPDIPEDIEGIFEEPDFIFEEEYFTWEEDFMIIDDYIVGDWEMDYEMEFNDDMYFEMEEEFVEMEMPEAFEEFDVTMMPEDSFEDMYMEEFEEFETFEDAFMEAPEEFEEMEMTEEMEMFEEFDTAMVTEEEFVEMEAPEEFTEMEMEEEFEEVAEMEAVEEEETVDMEVEEEEDVVEMGEENEETEVVENEESMESSEESTDESETEVAEESESEDGPQEIAENKEEAIGEDNIEEGKLVENKVTVSKDIKIGKVEVGEIKVAVNPRDIFKEAVNLDTYSQKDFYKDPGLNYAVNDDFFDQLSMIEYSKEIYDNVTLVAYIQGDPIAAHRREMEELAIQKTGIMIELDILRRSK